MNKKTSFTIGRFLLQYLPALGTLLMTTHCGLLLLGHDHVTIIENALGFSLTGCVMLLLFSYLMQYCWFHRAMIIYTTAVELCINLKPYGVFGDLLTEARWTMFLIGCALIAYLIIHIRKYNTRCNGKQQSFENTPC